MEGEKELRSKKGGKRHIFALSIATVVIIILIFSYLVLIEINKQSQVLVLSPGNAQNQIIALIDSANHTIDIEMYIFTNKEIAYSLIMAEERGVDVRVILGLTEGTGIEDVISVLVFNEIPIRKGAFKTMHSKFAVIDSKIVLIGSHNWSKSAMESNREASIITQDIGIATQLLVIFEEDWKKAMPITPIS